MPIRQYYEEAKRRNIAKAEITDEEMHVLCMIFWTSVYELSFMKCLGKKLKSIAKLYADSWMKNAVGIMD